MLAPLHVWNCHEHRCDFVKDNHDNCSLSLRKVNPGDKRRHPCVPFGGGDRQSRSIAEGRSAQQMSSD